MHDLKIPQAFEYLFTPARYKAAYGGRGSAKSHSYAAALVTMAAQRQMRILCCREIQNSIADSVKALLDDKIRAAGLTAFFTSTKTEITGANGSRFFFAGLRTNADSIKSMEGIDVAWVEEANRVSRRSLDLLIPTVRKEGSEIWFTWNPESEFDPVDLMFRGPHPPPDSVIKRVGYADNPWFPGVLRKEMEHDLRVDPEKHAHIWGGSYRGAPSGSYWGGLLARAQADGRIGRVPHDPSLEVHAAFDLGVGKNMAVTFAQWIGREIRLIDFLEGDDQAGDEGLAWFARRMKERPYNYAPIILPHDANAREIGTGKTRESVLTQLGFRTNILPRDNVEDGIEAVRRLLPMCWIDATKCADGLKAWREYRENYDEKNRVSRGPLHDWTSHAADSLRMMAMAYEQPQQSRPSRPRYAMNGGAWMGA